MNNFKSNLYQITLIKQERLRNIYQINTPFLDYQNDEIMFYMIESHKNIMITDDGWTHDEFQSHNNQSFEDVMIKTKIKNIYHIQIRDELQIKFQKNNFNLDESLNQFTQLLIFLNGLLLYQEQHF